MSDERELEILIRELDSMRAERTSLLKAMEPMQERIRFLHAEQEPLLERRDELRVKRMGGNPDWAALVRELGGLRESSASRVLCAYADEQLRRFDMVRSGYWTDTGDTSIKLKVERNDESVRKNIEGVKALTPFLSVHEHEHSVDETDGRPKTVWFGIFEHTLSAYRTYRLEVTPDFSVIKVTSGGRGYKATEAEFKTVEEAVTFVRERHWYGGEVDDEEAEIRRTINRVM